LRHDLTSLLARHELRPRPSDANFLLCDGPAGIRRDLLQHGILVRDCSSFGLPDLVRIAVPGPSGLERLAVALENVRPVNG